jgi:hypothetical protein
MHRSLEHEETTRDVLEMQWIAGMKSVGPELTENQVRFVKYRN